MKTLSLLIGTALLVCSAVLVFKEYRVETSYECAVPTLITTKRVTWAWEWYALEKLQGRNLCAGGFSEFTVYRPFDIAAGVFVAACTTLYIGFKRPITPKLSKVD